MYTEKQRVFVAGCRALLVVLVITSGCVRGQRVLAPGELGQQSPAYPAIDAQAEADDPQAMLGVDAHRPWWRMFSEPELEALVAEALTGNRSLETAWRRLEQSGYLLRATQAARFPQGQVTGFAGQARQLREGSVATEDVWGVSAAVSYEIDLWQRISASVSRAERLRDAGAYEAEVVAVSVAAAVCDAWLSLQEGHLNVALLEQQLETARSALEAVEARYRRGLGDLLGVYQQRELVAGIDALLPSARATISLSQYRLAVLVGRSPTAFSREPEEEDVALPAPVEFPDSASVSAWIAARPDVRAAGTRLQAAEAEQARAVRSRLPSVQLSVQGATREDQADALFDRFTGEGLLQVSVPVFDGGRLRAEAARAREVLAEQEASYSNTVLQAEQEVREADMLARSQEQTVARLEAELQAAQNTWSLSEERYRNGLVEYLNVLTAQQRVYQLQRSLLRARRQHLTYQVQFGRATAGSAMDQNGEDY